ncbi:long-chain fatty acid--CoA ligase, partial [Acidobacteria bacterium AH-259-D05]|nr:long-chain fatty acid--CoA ligase [Acidobacteria bacterium AH-259-D05]
MDNVIEVTVGKEHNPITGSIVSAKVRLAKEEDPREFKKRLKAYCSSRLPPYKVPVRITVSKDDQTSARMKKVRNSLNS